MDCLRWAVTVFQYMNITDFSQVYNLILMILIDSLTKGVISGYGDKPFTYESEKLFSTYWMKLATVEFYKKS